MSLPLDEAAERVNVQVTRGDDMLTSLGRSEAHIVVQVDPKDANTTSVSVEARVPEKVNLSCHLEEGGTIQIDKKVEGDVELSTTEGDLLLNKLRGYQISLQAMNGTIYASDLLEAQRLSLSSSRLRAKRIHGSHLDVQVKQKEGQVTAIMDADDEGAAIDISSLYVSGNGETNLVAQSASEKSIRCKSNHGHVNAQANGLIEMGGINGSFDVSTDGEAHVHIDSLSPDSISVVTCQEALLLTVDRKLEADLRLVSGTNVQGLARSVLLEEDDEELIVQGLKEHDETLSSSSASTPPISVVTSAFTEKALSTAAGTSTFDSLSYVQGHVDNQSFEPDSRFEQQQNLGGGKIRLEGAATQALKGFGSSDDDDADIVRPLVVGASEKRIAVESLSWLGAIARRYGLEEGERKEDLGRQATRRGRDLVPSKD